MATLGKTRIKDLVTNSDQMTKTVYDPDDDGKIDHNELENIGQRVFVQVDAPTDPNVNDIWIKI